MCLFIKASKYDENNEESISIIDTCNDKAIQEVMAAILIQGKLWTYMLAL